MHELEKLKGTASVADNIMATDRNFTKVKLDVEDINQQSNENAEQIANRVKKDGDDITGVISLDRVSYYNLCNTINIRGVTKFLISTRIRAISSGNPVTLHLLSTGVDLNILDIILKFDTTLGPTVKYVGAHSRNAHVPELKVGIDADGYFLIGVNSNSLSYGNISITALARNKNTLGAVSERFQITPDADLPLTAVSITSIPYTSKGSAIV